MKKGTKIITINDSREWIAHKDISNEEHEFDFIATYNDSLTFNNVSMGGSRWFKYEDEGIVWEFKQ